MLIQSPKRKFLNYNSTALKRNTLAVAETKKLLLVMKNTYNPPNADLKLQSEKINDLKSVLKKRFENNMNRHPKIKWEEVWLQLTDNPQKLWAVHQMEETGGEPDIVIFSNNPHQPVFCDCSSESPKNRRSICYDQDALESRIKHKPYHSAEGMAAEMGIQLLSEQQYSELQILGEFDLKTSSWVYTPKEVRALGGAVFGDRRYNRVFIYHNGAESYYAARGFRGFLEL
jgi:hypothetical protein